MEHAFFRATPSDENEDVLGLFEGALEAFEKEFKTNQAYFGCFQANLSALTYLAKKEKSSQLPPVYLALWEKVKDKVLSPNHYHSRKKEFFDQDELKYIAAFRITNKRVLTELEDNSQIDQAWFRKFLVVSTLFCKAFGFKLSRPGTGKITVEKTAARKLDGHTDYYLFYNRSAIKKMGTGVGKVSINGRSALIDYYYKPKDGKKTYDLLKTAGEISYYERSSILVLRHVKDIPDGDDRKSEGPVESFYVLKQSRQAGESLLLGILCTWNRDKGYPVSSAVLLIEKTYYDKQYPSGQPFAFDIEKIVSSREILPRITYFLLHQSISLEAVIDQRTNPLDNKYQPFSTLDHIPFYATQAKHLALVTGRYKGFSIIPMGKRHLIVLSELVIHPTGRVELNNNTGFVKLVEIKEDLRGRIFISFKHDFEKRYNALDHFLEFTMKRHNQPPEFLQGAFAGQSLLTSEPVAATVVFQRIEKSTPFAVEKLVLDEQDHHSLDRLAELYNANQSLFQLFHHETDSYTNHSGVNFLRKILPLDQNLDIKIKPKKQVDFFISIPLSSPKSGDEYLRNARLAQNLRSELSTTFQIKPDNIYCSCLEAGEIIEYKTYIAHSGSQAVEDMLQILELAKVLILVYPQKMNRQQTAISSSLIEVGFAIGTKKKILVFYDGSETRNLPKSLMHLSNKHAFTFKTNSVNPFHKMFHFEKNYNRMVDLLLGSGDLR